MILDRHQSSHASNHEGLFRQTQFFPYREPGFPTQCKSPGIYAVVNKAHALRVNPCLARMKIAQFPSDSENCIRHGVCRTPKQAAAQRQACEQFEFIPMLAMNHYRSAGQFGGGHGLNRSPIACMEDVRTVLANNASQAEKRELQFEFGASRDIHLFLGKGRSYKVPIESPGSADAVFKPLAKPGHQLQYTDLRPTAAHVADDMQNTQAIRILRGRTAEDRGRGTVAFHFSFVLHLQ